VKHEDDFIEGWRTERIDNSRPPLRWIANFLGNLSSSAMMRMFNAEEDGKENTFAYKRDLFIWDKCWPIYDKYGTVYKLELEDEDGDM
jgi:hypothetical protein